MRKLFVILGFISCFLFFSVTCNASGLMDVHVEKKNIYGIKFVQAPWLNILDQAKSENKLIFVDFYTQWCGPCYNMARHVFTLPEVGTFYNKNFVCAKIDAESQEGAVLAKKYGVRSYPTYAFINAATGELVHSSGGRQEPAQFLYTGKSALIPKLNSAYLKAEYAKGNRDKDFLINYIRYSHTVYDRKGVLTAFDELIKGGAQLTNETVWNLFVEAIPSLTPYLKEVSDNYDKYCALFGKEVVDAKMMKETQYGDLSEIESFCDFDGKELNCEFIRINNALYRQHNYDEAIRRIDALIADSTINQQAVIDRLRFIARLNNSHSSEIPQRWFDKCIEYLRYVAYNNADRDDAVIHQSYAEALEQVIKRIHQNGEIPNGLSKVPQHGKTEYTMRPDDLKMKPQYRKK